jgi:hypothetical protein
MIWRRISTPYLHRNGVFVGRKMPKENSSIWTGAAKRAI